MCAYNIRVLIRLVVPILGTAARVDNWGRMRGGADVEGACIGLLLVWRALELSRAPKDAPAVFLKC